MVIMVMVTKKMVVNMKCSVMLMLLLLTTWSMANEEEEDLPSAEAITLVVKQEDMELPSMESGYQGCLVIFLDQQTGPTELVQHVVLFYTGWGRRMSHRKWNDIQNGPSFHFLCDILHPYTILLNKYLANPMNM